MNLTVRGVATSLAVGFAVYFAARGIWWIIQPSAPLLMVAAIGIYLAVVLMATLVDTATEVRMPLWTSVFALIAAAVAPPLTTLALEPSVRTAPFATWYIGGIGLLAVVCIVRRRFWTGWAVLAILVVAACISLGMTNALTLGLVGSIMWVVVAHLLVMFWERAVRDTERLAGIQQAVSAWHATQQVRQRERRVRTQFALAVAGPILTRTVVSRGALSEEERLTARLAEGQLRDELRGANLLNDAVRAAITDARRRGVAVTVFDEGGLEGISEGRCAEIHDELAAVLTTAHTGRLIIRAARDAKTAVTVVGRSEAGASHDDDAVDLWHEIMREPAAD